MTKIPVLAVPDDPYLAQASPEALMSFQQHLMQFEKAGYTVKRGAALHAIQSVNRKYQQLTSAEMAQAHESWFATYAPLYRPRTAKKIRAGQKVGMEQVVQARAGRAILRSELEAVMRQDGIDLWVCPAAAGPAPKV